MLNELWYIEFLGNPIMEYIHCVLILAVGLVMKRLIAKFLSQQSFRLVKKITNNQFSNEFVILLHKPVEQLLTLIIIYFAFDRLNFPDSWKLVTSEKFGLRWALFTIWMIAMFIVSTRIVMRAIDFMMFALIHREHAPVSSQLANFLKELIKVLVVILAVFVGIRFILHLNITPFLASLGIGGLAVALAAQDTLANLLGSFIIYLDKPFKVGDSIEAGEIKGTVEHVGFRTTRIRTSDKSLLIAPNKKMVDSLLNNITLSDMRRVRFNLTLSYTTKPDQIMAIIADIKEAISMHEHTTGDNVVRFSEFDNGSLNILIVYFVQGNEFATMIDTKEQLNIEIMKIVDRHGTQLANSSQTIVIQKDA